MNDATQPRFARRLSDTILIAFHHARDRGEFEIAGRLLLVLEFMLKRPPYLPVGENRRAQESLVAAYERLWEIRHPTPPVVR